MQESKAGMRGMKRARLFEHWCRFVKASLLQTDRTHQRHQFVTRATRQKLLCHIVRGREIADLQQLPTLGDGSVCGHDFWAIFWTNF